jgi:hypothetical protein
VLVRTPNLITKRKGSQVKVGANGDERQCCFRLIEKERRRKRSENRSFDKVVDGTRTRDSYEGWRG